MPARASCLYLALAAALALSARAAAPEPAQLEKPQPLTPHWGSCPDCAPAPPADALRLEAIKLQILTRLGLDDRPAPRRPLPRAMLLETLAKAAEEDGEVAGAGGSYRQGLLEREQNEAEEHIADSALDYDDYFGRTSEIIVFAEPGEMLNGQQLVEFTLSGEETRPSGGSGVLRVRRATLWLRAELWPSLTRRLRMRARRSRLTLWAFRVGSRAANDTRLGAEAFAAATSVRGTALGWQRLDVTEAARRWVELGGGRMRLLLDCSGCDGLVRLRLADAEAGRPFVVLRAEAGGARRVRRRALDCAGAPQGHCCKQPFYVSFRSLGWDDWIIAPHGYYANYCRGACGARAPDAFLSPYAHVVEEARRLDRLAGLRPCCAPLKFSAMSLIYFGPDSNIIKRDLPKMVVDECGCP